MIYYMFLSFLPLKYNYVAYITICIRSS